MNTEVLFLRQTAKKLQQRRYFDDLPTEAWKETILCQVEFLTMADAIEKHCRPAEQAIVKPKPLPKVYPPREDVAVSAEAKFQQPEEETIAAKRALRPIEPLTVEQRNEVLILKDLSRKKSLIPKDLQKIETGNVGQHAEIEPPFEVVPKTLKTKPELVRKPNRAPKVEKEAEISLERLVKLQRGRCAYCFRMFNSRVFSDKKIVELHATREHFVPESMDGKIIFAACQICNLFKRDYIFKTIAACRKFLAEMWERSGYHDANGHFIADSQMFSKN